MNKRMCSIEGSGIPKFDFQYIFFKQDISVDIQTG